MIAGEIAVENAGREPFQGTDLRAMVDNAPKGGLPAAGHGARLVTDRATAQRLADFLTESLDEQDVVVAAFGSGGGRWTTAVYFSGRPNEAATRALVALEMGAELANALVFERVGGINQGLGGGKPRGPRPGRGRPASWCMGGMTGRACAPIASASRSKPRSPSAPAITAPRAAACWRWIIWRSGSTQNPPQPSPFQ